MNCYTAKQIKKLKKAYDALAAAPDVVEVLSSGFTDYSTHECMVHTAIDGGTFIDEPDEDADPSLIFWGLYGYDAEGDCHHIADFPEEEVATQMRDAFKALLPQDDD